MLQFSGGLRDQGKASASQRLGGENGVYAFVLIASAFHSVLSMINQRIITLGGDQTHCESQGRCAGKNTIRIRVALNRHSTISFISGDEEASALRGS